jgi:hypothetical protein
VLPPSSRALARHGCPQAGGGLWISCELPPTPVDKPVQNPVDKAARGRLRDAILSEDGDEEQLQGVLRMLGERDLRQGPFPVFDKASDEQAPNA